VCGLQLAVPAASELLAASTRVYEAERGRQAVIARMWSDQAAAFATAGAAGLSFSYRTRLGVTPR
jgi:hypothetical protein